MPVVPVILVTKTEHFIHCQFLFSGSRKMSEEIIPRLLYKGKEVWSTDMQYFLDHELDRRNAE